MKMRHRRAKLLTTSALAVTSAMVLLLPVNSAQAKSAALVSVARSGRHLPASAHVLRPANEPVCVTTGILRKREDCSLRDLYRKVRDGSSRDILAMHLFLASKDISSTKSLFGPFAKSASAGNSACLVAMRDAQLEVVPKLAKSLSNVQKGLRFIDGVGIALNAADRIGQTQRILTLLIEQGAKAAATQVGKEAAAEKLPDVKSALTEIAKALTSGLSSYSISSLVRGDYSSAVMSSAKC